MTDLPRVPAFNLTRVFNLRARLADEDFFSLYGVVLEGPLFVTLVRVVTRRLRADPYVVEASLRHLLGRELTRAEGTRVAWRLAGNAATIRQGIPVPPWTRQTESEWVPVQVTDQRYHLHRATHRAHVVTGRQLLLQTLAGTCCPLEIETFRSNEQLQLLAYHLGFARAREGRTCSPLVRRSLDELFGKRFVVLVEPHRCTREPGFYHARCPASFVAYNRELIRLHRRIDFTCPREYTHECYQCPVGLVSCPAATHTQDYVLRPCSGCGREWWFDPGSRWPHTYCVECQPRADSGLLSLPAPGSSTERANDG